MDRIEELQLALARLVGEVRRGALVDPDRRAPQRNASVAEAEALLRRMDTPAELYVRSLPPVPPMRPVGDDEV